MVLDDFPSSILHLTARDMVGNKNTFIVFLLYVCYVVFYLIDLCKYAVSHSHAHDIHMQGCGCKSLPPQANKLQDLSQREHIPGEKKYRNRKNRCHVFTWDTVWLIHCIIYALTVCVCVSLVLDENQDNQANFLQAWSALQSSEIIMNFSDQYLTKQRCLCRIVVRQKSKGSVSIFTKSIIISVFSNTIPLV